MRFDEPGLFYVPELYRRDKAEKTGQREKPTRPIPPIPETGWAPRADFPDLSGAPFIAFDTETYDPDLMEKGPGSRRDGYIVGVSVAVPGWSRYYPVAHSIGPNLDKVPVFQWLRDQLKGPQLKIGANILYDLDFLHYEGVKVGGRFYDVLLADPLIYEYEMSYSLDSVARRRLQGKGKETSVLYEWCAEAYGGKATEQRENIWRSPSTLVGPYAEADASLPIEIMHAQIPILRNMDQIGIARLEMGLIPLLLRMRLQGVRIDLPRAEEIDAMLSAQIPKLYEQLGIESVYSADDLVKLCEREGITYPRTALDNPSFVKDWLLAHPHPALQQVAELRKLSKLRDTFVRGHLLGSHVNGRIHCEFHPLRSDEYGTVSGRFSSSNPNLQQITARDKYWAPIIRSAFLPEEGELWNKDDLSQIEFRLGVHFGKGRGVEDVRAAYISDPKTDFYNLAVTLTGLDRQEAKSLSLGTLFGMGLDKFASMIGKSVEEARVIFNTFNRKLPFMRDTYNYYAKYVEETRTENEDGWVRTIGGRLCHLQYGYEHKALNRLLQGSCADWIKRAMLDGLEAGVFDVLSLLLTVHDELDSSIPRTNAGVEATQELHQIMANAYTASVPVLCGVDIGATWGSLKKVASNEDYASIILAAA